jgi:LysR family cys regulon transcriptional activator
MEIKELRSLAVLAKTGSITRAAEALHLTPSAIHRQLQILSEDLNLELYEKVGKSLRLTPEGKSLLPLIEDLLLQFESVQAAAQDIQQLNRGWVRLASGPTFSSYVLPDFLESFRARYPSVSVFLEAGHTTQLIAELEDGYLDILFLALQAGMTRKFVVEASWEFEVIFVTSRRLGPSGRVALKSLIDYPFLLYRHGSFFEEQIDQYFQRHDFVPNVMMRIDNAEPMKALVRSGFGIAPIPSWAVQKEINAGELLAVRLEEPPLVSRIGMIRRRLRHVSPPSAAFIAMAKEWPGFSCNAPMGHK